MYNRELTNVPFMEEKAVVNGVSITAEGQLLVSVIEDNVEKVKPCAGTSGEVAVGFSTSTRLFVDKEVAAKAARVPAVAPYQYDLGATQLIAGQVRVTIEGVAATIVTVAPAAAGEVQIDLVHGLLVFHADDAGKAFEAFFKRNLTVEEARSKYREGFLFNARAFEIYGKVGVFTGKGQIYTDQFDVGAAYGAGALKTFAGGLVSTAGAGTTLTNVRVIAVPTLAQPWLGLEFNL